MLMDDSYDFCHIAMNNEPFAITIIITCYEKASGY